MHVMLQKCTLELQVLASRRQLLMWKAVGVDGPVSWAAAEVRCDWHGELRLKRYILLLLGRRHGVLRLEHHDLPLLLLGKCHRLSISTYVSILALPLPIVVRHVDGGSLRDLRKSMS